MTAAPDDGLKPSAMRGNERMYGLIVAAELLVVAILNITVTHGKGAPTHPQTALHVLGVAAALALFGVLRTNNRMIVGFGSIIAAFFVTLPRVPTSLSGAHIFALAVPLAYALILTQRQRKAASAQAGGRVRPTPAERRESRRRGSKQPEPSGPQQSRRYTPPKSKRQSGKTSGRR